MSIYRYYDKDFRVDKYYMERARRSDLFLGTARGYYGISS